MKRKWTPPQLAKRWGISPDKVVFWIKNGELHAIDASMRRGQRPRYLIDEEDIKDFEARRSASPPPKPKRRRKQSATVTEYY